MEVLKYGAIQNKEAVKELQKLLALPQDGIFGKATLEAVKVIQRQNGLVPDGIVGELTWEACKGEAVKYIIDSWKEIQETFLKRAKENGITIIPYPLSDDEYVKSYSLKKGFLLHHTVSDGNPYKVIDYFNHDDRGRVSVSFVVGRKTDDGDTKYDGVVLMPYPLWYWGYSLGISTPMRDTIEKSLISFELCNWGKLGYQKGAYYTTTNKVISKDEVCSFELNFRGGMFYHAYTQKQVDAVAWIIQTLSLQLALPPLQGLESFANFAYNPKDLQRVPTKTLYGHTNPNRRA